MYKSGQDAVRHPGRDGGEPRRAASRSWSPQAAVGAGAAVVPRQPVRSVLGPPRGRLGDTPPRTLRTRPERLDAIRLLAVSEGWAEAKVALGQHDDLLDRLDALTRRHPFRERLHRVQMLSLYRGRPADGGAGPVRGPAAVARAGVGLRHRADRPDASRRVPRTRAERRGRLAGRRNHPRHRQQLRHTVHRRAVRADPVETPDLDAIPAQDGALPGRDQDQVRLT